MLEGNVSVIQAVRTLSKSAFTTVAMARAWRCVTFDQSETFTIG